jgi:hypothetical protein
MAADGALVRALAGVWTLSHTKGKSATARNRERGIGK